MRYKYVRQGVKFAPNNRQGRYVDPERWITGPDPLRREKYYAYLKHKAQCNFRGEDYELTWQDWETMWSDQQFLQRGKTVDSLCLTRIDYDLPWAEYNCQIVTRKDHLKRNSEFRRNG